MSTCILCRHVLCFKLYIIIKCFDAGGLKLLLYCRGVFQRHCHDDIILFESDNASLTDAISNHMDMHLHMCKQVLSSHRPHVQYLILQVPMHCKNTGGLEIFHHYWWIDELYAFNLYCNS